MLNLLVGWYYGLQASIWLYCLSWRRRHLAQSVLQKYRQPGKRPWAVISGASDGIGLGFARVLVEAGWSVMLLGRDAAKLARVEKELAAVSGTETVEVESFVCEAGLRGAELTARLGELKEVRLAGKDVALVVNNVGMTEGIFGWFGDAEEDWADERAEFEDADKTIRVNCIFPSKLTNCLLPLLVGRSSPSAIINLSSVLAWMPCPFNPIYGASKSFNRAFSRALTAEYAHLGIDVLCVCPGLVQSQLTGLQPGSLLGTSPVSTAEGALSCLGVEVECFPHYLHGVTGAAAVVLAWLPAKMVAVMVALLLRFLPKPPGIKVSRDMRVQ